MVVVGTGIAGLTSALYLLDNSYSVILVEKENHFGGNSKYASSGINGVPKENKTALESFRQDTLRASGFNSNTIKRSNFFFLFYCKLIDTLVENSWEAI